MWQKDKTWYFRLEQGKPGIIRLNVSDADGDMVKCSLDQRECGGVCKLPLGFELIKVRTNFISLLCSID